MLDARRIEGVKDYVRGDKPKRGTGRTIVRYIDRILRWDDVQLPIVLSLAMCQSTEG